jgi:hypothetical protein
VNHDDKSANDNLQECDTRKIFSFLLSIYHLLYLSLPSRDIIADSIEAVSPSLDDKLSNAILC